MKEETRKPEDIIGKPLAYMLPAQKRDGEAPAESSSRLIDLTFSSDAPIRHWFGTIILDHGAKSIRLNRLRTNGPFLSNHNWNAKLGRVRGAETDGHVGSAKVQITRNPIGETFLNDYQDDLCTGISVGFVIHKLVMEEQTDEETVYRATDWEPFEVSDANIPADTNPGYVRELSFAADQPLPEALTRLLAERAAEETPEEEATEDPEEEAAEDADPAEGTDPNEEEPATEADPQRTAIPIEVRTLTMETTESTTQFEELGRFFGEPEMARDFFAGGKTTEEFKTAIIEKRKAAQTQIRQEPLVDLSPSEKKRYSICRAIMLDARARDKDVGKVDGGFETEIHDEIVRQLGHEPKHGGIFIPTAMTRAGLDAATSTKGIETVFTSPGEFIELLRNKAMVMALGATFLPGLRDNIAFPRQTGAGSFSWVGENPGSDVGESNILLDQVLMSPKIGQSTTSYSRNLLNQGVPSVDLLVMDDMAAINALEVDRAAIHGLGSSNQPRGVYNQSGIGSVTFGGAITFAKAVDMETAITGVNADVGTMAYLTTPNVKGTAKKTLEFSAAGATAIWKDDEINGYRAAASNQVSKTLGSGSDHGILFGVWSQLLIGEWGALEIITDPYAKKKQGMIEVTSYLSVDTAVRHAASFCKGATLVP